MTTMTRRRGNPVAEMLNWLEEPGMGLRGIGLVPEIRVEDFMRDNTYVLRAEIPGIDPEKDLDVHMMGDRLVVSGSRQEEQHDKHRQEFHYGTFYRSVRLPQGVDVEKIDATFRDGVLEVTLPVEAPADQRTQIPVHREGS
jgi:HSP20 family protein